MALCFYYYASHSPNFEIKAIKIKGNNFLSTADVLKKVKIEPHTNIFEIKPIEIKNQLEQDVWIKKAAVRREFPDRLIIELQERKPFIFWLSTRRPERKGYLVDPEGVILKEIREDDEMGIDLPVFTNEALENPGALTNPTVVGAEKETIFTIQRAISEIAKILQADIPLFKQIKEIALSDVGNLTLIPSTQTPEVRIHLRDYQKNLEYLKALLPRLDMMTLEYIDLRFKKRVIIKPNNS